MKKKDPSLYEPATISNGKTQEMTNASAQDSPEDDQENDRGSEAAGVVRGISRCLGRGAARPMIGRLPRQVVRRRLPIKQVARVSDRLSTGYDWWSTAVESQQSSSKRWQQFRAFAGNLIKNTLLGLAVFESYGYVVGQLAPPPAEESSTLSTGSYDSKLHIEQNSSKSNFLMDQDDNYDDDPEGEESLILDGKPDEYARASLVAHWTAGAVAGSVHGLATSAVEGGGTKIATAARKQWIQQAAYHTVHHTFAHSVLFGSYELLKRSIIHELHKDDDDDDSKATYLGGSYLAGFGLAGGLAGQLQHLVSHYTESLTFESGITSTKFSHRLVVPRAPAIRPLLMAFPPSAIGFIAFEYGKNL